jgi:hypothetical protein
VQTALEEDEESEYESSVLAATLADSIQGGIQLFGDNEVLLDNQEGRSKQKLSHRGATGVENTVKESGMSLDFGRVGVCDAVVANLLSAGEMVTNDLAVSVRDDVYYLEVGGRYLALLVKCIIGDHCDTFVTVEENMRRHSAREVR